MTRLALLVFSMASVTLMGVCVLAVLLLGQDTPARIAAAAAVGLAAAVPVSWMVARRIA